MDNKCFSIWFTPLAKPITYSFEHYGLDKKLQASVSEGHSTYNVQENKYVPKLLEK
jgi:hypothetical protein